MSESDIRGGVGVVPDLASLIRATNCGLSASLRAQRSNPSFRARGDKGLLRCARNDGGYSFAFSRRIAPEVCIFVCPLKTEGAGKTGCALHPRSRVPNAQTKTHTSIQVQRKHPGLPCAVALRLTSCSPR